jgi:hypothetical protein
MEPDAVFTALSGLTRNPEKKRLIDVKMIANYFTKAIFHATICEDQRFVCGPAFNASAFACMATSDALLYRTEARAIANW